MKTNNNFDNITLSKLATMVANGFEQVDKRFEQTATKDDLKRLATKDELKKLATKDDLETLAQTVAKGFEQTATKTELDGLRKEMQAGFSYVNITLDKHMGDVREQTDSLAHRVKRLEESVFGAGK